MSRNAQPHNPLAHAEAVVWVFFPKNAVDRLWSLSFKDKSMELTMPMPERPQMSMPLWLAASPRWDFETAGESLGSISNGLSMISPLKWRFTNISHLIAAIATIVSHRQFGEKCFFPSIQQRSSKLVWTTDNQKKLCIRTQSKPALQACNFGRAVFFLQ